jgi:hypothetical protein
MATNGRKKVVKRLLMAGAAATLVVAGTVRAEEASPDSTKPEGAQVHALRVYEGTGSGTAEVRECRCGPGMVVPGSVADPPQPSVSPPARERSGDRGRQSDVNDARGVSEGNSGGRG